MAAAGCLPRHVMGHEGGAGGGGRVEAGGVVVLRHEGDDKAGLSEKAPAQG